MAIHGFTARQKSHTVSKSALYWLVQVHPIPALAELNALKLLNPVPFTLARSSPLQPLSWTDLIANVVAESHVSIQLATVEQISLLKLRAQSLAFNQVNTADVGNIPKATETQQKKRETWNTTETDTAALDRMIGSTAASARLA